jgi:hypothetical protein
VYSFHPLCAALLLADLHEEVAHLQHPPDVIVRSLAFPSHISHRHHSKPTRVRLAFAIYISWLVLRCTGVYVIHAVHDCNII